MKLPSLFLMIMILFLLAGGLTFAQESEDFSLPEVFEYPATGGRDPFFPLIVEKKEEVKQKPQELKSISQPEEKKPLPVITRSEYKLVGIVWQGEESVALISKQGKNWVVKEGMSIDNFKVARIEGKEGRVTLLGEDKIIQLNMLEI